MKKTLFLFIFILVLLTENVCSPVVVEDKVYAVVVSKSTLSKPGWKKIVDKLVEKYSALVLVYKDDLREVHFNLSRLAPDYVCFIATLNEASPEFVKSVNRLMRELDSDPYVDAIWAILTGYSYEDILKILSLSRLKVKRILACCCVKWVYYVKEGGVMKPETKYGLLYIIYPNGTKVEKKIPKDSTLLLADLVNSNQFDMIITSGHGNHNRWQVHYPSPWPEGYFISQDGKVYAIAANNSARLIKSTNPKIYFGLGNCYIGAILGKDSMAPAWIHSGGAVFYTGYVIEEGPYSYMMGGIPAYFIEQDNYTWAEAFFANQQSAIFDMINLVPGPNHEYLKKDINGPALYGDPALDVRAEVSIKRMYTRFIHVEYLNQTCMNITVGIVMNKDGTPGWNGKWGNRHPVIVLPFRVENVTVISTNAYKAVVADNFVLLYVWKKGDPPLKKGSVYYVSFTAYLMKRPRKIPSAEKKEAFLWTTLVVLLAGVSAVVIVLVVFKIRKKIFSKSTSEFT